MPVSVCIQNRRQILVPLRVDRAVRGAPVIDAPDVDDRGFVNNRCAGLNVIEVRGSLFGITVGDTVRVRVAREDIDDTAPLYLATSSSSQPQVEIALPAGGGPLPADGIFHVRAIADTTVGQSIQVRLGSTTGSILAEADPHVFTPRRLVVTPHLCTIHRAASRPGTGTPPTLGGNPFDLNALFDIVGAIWRPAGVQFQVSALREEEYFGFTRDDFARWDNTNGPGSENRVVNQHNIGGTCNIYFIRYMDNSLGVGVNRDTMASEGWTRPGIIIGVEGSIRRNGTISNRTSAGADLIHEIGNDIAHEIGHFLTLSHAHRVDSPGLADTYGRRHLMHPNNLLTSSAAGGPRFDDIGYGAVGGRGHRGCLLTLKDHPTHNTDGEVMQARRRFRSPNLY
jgi:hypothetical protein